MEPVLSSGSHHRRRKSNPDRRILPSQSTFPQTPFYAHDDQRLRYIELPSRTLMVYRGVAFTDAFAPHSVHLPKGPSLRTEWPKGLLLSIRYTYSRSMGDLPTLHFGYSGSNERTRLWFDNGDSEEVLLTPLDDNLYRLDESSILGEAMYGGVIRASRREAGGLHFLGVETRSKLVSQSWCLSQAIIESAECNSVLSEVAAMGGMWERAFGGILLIHAPQGLEGEIADRIERLMTPSRDSTNEPLSDKR